MENIHGKSGIYEIRHIATGKAYCGRTKNLGQRRDFHFGQLSRGKHHNYLLQSAYDSSADGENGFSFEVVDYCDDVADLIAMEQSMLDSGDYAFNIKRNAASGFTGQRRALREYRTPWGIFHSVQEAAENGFMSSTSVGRHCQFPDEMISRASFAQSRFLRTNYDEAIIGQLTWRDIGFGYERKHLV